MNPFNFDIEQLNQKALDIRRDIITLLVESQSGHSGGPLSCADMAAALYFNILNHNPGNPDDPVRDLNFFSIGHVSPLIYSVLAEAGYFPLRDLLTFRKLNSHLEGHPNCLHTPGIEVSAGSLGQGLSIACGAAYGIKMDGSERSVFCFMGDGEQQEGSIWEAVMFAAHYRLDNLCALIDYNHRQIDGETEKVMNIAPLAEKYWSFGWNVYEIDGHNMGEILGALKACSEFTGKPSVIIGHTVMGKGVSFMEGLAEWHGKPPAPDQGEKALAELGTTFREWSERLRNG
ncbi:MAG TPA: transketolase [candidate division Zixibacteria bacterium]|nr:transketolase [candidate division Zixibacteria bacterium]HEQ97993.1 transketolase [candidate division Zixibacteria bacterium]